jgi:hypothetical protein
MRFKVNLQYQGFFAKMLATATMAVLILLAMATLGDATPIVPFLFVSN